MTFTATVLQSGDVLSGSTHEPNTFQGVQGSMLYASLVGRREGSNVSFEKVYANVPRSRYVTKVFYKGDLTADGSEIEGRWTIRAFPWGRMSGSFLMIRGKRREIAVETKTRVEA